MDEINKNKNNTINNGSKNVLFISKDIFIEIILNL